MVIADHMRNTTAITNTKHMGFYSKKKIKKGKSKLTDLDHKE